MGLNSIEVQGVGKRYVLGAGAEYTTLREFLTLVATRQRQARATEVMWALRDVSFVMEQGEVLGVVGANGAGKSTLLKVLARITEPTEGVARLRGRLASLLEVGTGFHEDLTGRENVFLNGAILGMTRREIDRRFDEIVEFSGVSRFLDVPVKRYSSGMKLRLAFSVAVHLDAEVVVVDEILAVGDAEFQRRCLAKMAEFRDSERTVLFVSHDLSAVARLCPRSLWLDAGRVRLDGPTDTVLDAYIGSVASRQLQVDLEHSSEAVHLRSMALVDLDGRPVQRIRQGEPFGVAIRYTALRDVTALDAAVYLERPDGLRVVDEALSDLGLARTVTPAGDHEAVLEFDGVLAAGEYLVGVWLGSAEKATHEERPVLSFELEPALESLDAEPRRRVLHGAARWRHAGR